MAVVKSAVVRGTTPRAVVVTATLEDALRAPQLIVEGMGNGGGLCEARVRVMSALDNIGWSQHVPRGQSTRVRVEYAHLPAGAEPLPIPPDAALDLPIAWAIAQAWGVAPERPIFCFGELSLDGRVRPVRGACVRMRALDQFELRPDTVFVPYDNAGEAATVAPVNAADHVGALTYEGAHPHLGKVDLVEGPFPVDFSECRLRPETLRAITVALVFGQPTLLMGPPGVGKTMIARRFASALPPMTEAQMRETLDICSVSGLVREDFGGATGRAFRAPHHSVSDVALIGGGPHGRPGEVSLAHNGVLFFDELPEFRRHAIEATGAVLRDGAARLRVQGGQGDTSVLARPAFVLGSANSCPCGYHGHPRQHCVCHPTAITAYRERVRRAAAAIGVRMVISVPAQGAVEIGASRSSTQIREQVVSAQAALAHIPPVSSGIEGYAVASRARICAALDGATAVQSEHLDEARGYVELLL